MLHGPYPSAEGFTDRWHALARRLGARVSSAGRSVEGRDIPRLDLPGEGPRVLLTALLHGVEVIGSLALMRAVEVLPRGVPVTILPIANPDAFHHNMSRLARGRVAMRRCNANGVDLNRNFPRVGACTSLHPFAGSTRRWSPHYVGPSPLSEPEARALVAVADEVEPELAIGFHSFGNMLLYPWAHTRAPNPRAALYEACGRVFARELRVARYRVGQATQLYPTVGDLDDWLDATHGTLAFTVEVSSLDRRLLHPLRALNPFCWMNPLDVEGTVDNVAPAIAALVGSARARRPRSGLARSRRRSQSELRAAPG